MNSSLYERACDFAQRFERAGVDEWRDVLADARHAGWAGPTVREVESGTFTLHKNGLDIRVMLSHNEDGSIAPMWADVTPLRFR